MITRHYIIWNLSPWIWALVCSRAWEIYDGSNYLVCNIIGRILAYKYPNYIHFHYGTLLLYRLTKFVVPLSYYYTDYDNFHDRCFRWRHIVCDGYFWLHFSSWFLNIVTLNDQEIRECRRNNVHMYMESEIQLILRIANCNILTQYKLLLGI